MLDRGGDPRLGGEALAEHRIVGALRGDQLDRHLPPQRQLGGAVDDPHAATPEDLLDPVAGDDRRRLESTLAGPMQNLLDDPAGVGREQAPQAPPLAAVGPHAEHHGPGGAHQQRGERIAVVEHRPGVERELRRHRPQAEDAQAGEAGAERPEPHPGERHE